MISSFMHELAIWLVVATVSLNCAGLLASLSSRVIHTISTPCTTRLAAVTRFAGLGSSPSMAFSLSELKSALMAGKPACANAGLTVSTCIQFNEGSQALMFPPKLSSHVSVVVSIRGPISFNKEFDGVSIGTHLLQLERRPA